MVLKQRGGCGGSLPPFANAMIHTNFLSCKHGDDMMFFFIGSMDGFKTAGGWGGPSPPIYKLSRQLLMRDRFCLMPMPDSQMHEDLVMGTTRPGDQRPGDHRTTKPEDHRARGPRGQRTAGPGDLNIGTLHML